MITRRAAHGPYLIYHPENAVSACIPPFHIITLCMFRIQRQFATAWTLDNPLSQLPRSCIEPEHRRRHLLQHRGGLLIDLHRSCPQHRSPHHEGVPGGMRN